MIPNMNIHIMLLFQYLLLPASLAGLGAHEQVQLKHGGLHGQLNPRAEDYGYSRALSSHAILPYMLRGVMYLHPEGAARGVKQELEWRTQ